MRVHLLRIKRIIERASHSFDGGRVNWFTKIHVYQRIFYQSRKQRAVQLYLCSNQS